MLTVVREILGQLRLSFSNVIQVMLLSQCWSNCLFLSRLPRFLQKTNKPPNLFAL